jgi:prepilin-type N-terminal cleavage/methylation domain-containing protein
MLYILHFFIKNKFKQESFIPIVRNGGFTLIELLVAMILAVLVITPLLSFMINILDTDRREQAKVNSEQELQAALNYIAQDLQQAIYIYDAKGISEIKDADGLPDHNDSNKEPVLVFWKREFKNKAIDVKVGASTVGRNDSFVYSLVAYYLIKDNAVNITNQIWSNQLRIARFEIKDGVRNPDVPIKQDGTPNYLPGTENQPDEGFELFKLSEVSGSLEVKMNAWKKKSGQAYKQKPVALIDYIDKSTNNVPPLVDCTTVFPDKALPSVPDEKKESLRVPATNNNGSFYACVDVDKTTAKVFIRGNAYARINKNESYDSSKATYFPQASVQVKGRGFIGVE